MAAASRRIARLKRIDRAAVFIITAGGLAVVVGVLGILLFIGAEAIPLFRSARVGSTPAAKLAGSPPSLDPAFRAVGVDEYRRYVFTVETDGRVVFRPLDASVSQQEFPFPGLTAAHVVASSKSHIGNFLAAGTDDGRVALAQVQYAPLYENDKLKDLKVSVVDRGIAEVDAAHRPVRQVAYV